MRDAYRPIDSDTDYEFTRYRLLRTVLALRKCQSVRPSRTAVRRLFYYLFNSAAVAREHVSENSHKGKPVIFPRGGWLRTGLPCHDRCRYSSGRVRGLATAVGSPLSRLILVLILDTPTIKYVPKYKKHLYEIFKYKRYLCFGSQSEQNGKKLITYILVLVWFTAVSCWSITLPGRYYNTLLISISGAKRGLYSGPGFCCVYTWYQVKCMKTLVEQHTTAVLLLVLVPEQNGGILCFGCL